MALALVRPSVVGSRRSRPAPPPRGSAAAPGEARSSGLKVSSGASTAGLGQTSRPVLKSHLAGLLTGVLVVLMTHF